MNTHHKKFQVTRALSSLKGQILKIFVLSVIVTVGAYAQTPQTTSYTSSGYPAKLCADYSSTVCVLVQVCPSNTNCGAHPSIGGSGGRGNIAVMGVLNNDFQNPVSWQTNSSANSQGFIVALVGTYDQWQFSSPDQNVCFPVSLLGATIGGGFKNSFSPGNYFYKALLRC